MSSPNRRLILTDISSSQNVTQLPSPSPNPSHRSQLLRRPQCAQTYPRRAPPRPNPNPSLNLKSARIHRSPHVC
ncbi:hypothetical protein FRC11_011222, partial [Ceratobasidium sp. 423]